MMRQQPTFTQLSGEIACCYGHCKSLRVCLLLAYERILTETVLVLPIIITKHELREQPFNSKMQQLYSTLLLCNTQMLTQNEAADVYAPVAWLEYPSQSVVAR